MLRPLSQQHSGKHGRGIPTPFPLLLKQQPPEEFRPIICICRAVLPALIMENSFKRVFKFFQSAAVRATRRKTHAEEELARLAADSQSSHEPSPQPGSTGGASQEEQPPSSSSSQHSYSPWLYLPMAHSYSCLVTMQVC